MITQPYVPNEAANTPKYLAPIPKGEIIKCPYADGAAFEVLQNVPATAVAADIHVWEQDVLFTINGDNPDLPSLVGHSQQVRQTYRLESREAILAFKAGSMDVPNASLLYVTYFESV